MPTFQFEALDAKGTEIRDVIEAENEEEAQSTIRQMGYFVTKISVKKSRKAEPGAKKAAGGKNKTFVLGGVKSHDLTVFTRNLAILQNAGLPILRSVKVLETQSKPGALKNALIDVVDNIEGGSTLSESMSKCPKAFNRLYCNMIRAGEAGGALEVILQRLADFQEKSLALKRKVKGAMVYPIVVIMVAVGILSFIMVKIVPEFAKIFKEFDTGLPPMTQALIDIADWMKVNWYLLALVPIGLWLCIKLIRKFELGRKGWDLFVLKIPIFGQIIEKNIVARTTRILGTLVSSGVPILEALNIARETSGNAVFENMYGKVYDAIREGDTISRPMKEHSMPAFQPVTLFFWLALCGGWAVPLMFFKLTQVIAWPCFGIGLMVGGLLYTVKSRQRVVDDIVINMVDVGEETGELDTMLYKVADNFDEVVKVLTDSLTSLLEPLLIIVLGGAVGFIVIALFMPLIALITKLSSAK